MSRIEYCEPNDVADELRMWAFDGNMWRHLNGRKGQAALLELEAALLALPEKKLVSSSFVVTPDGESDGAVCALGAVALYRKQQQGLDRAAALVQINSEHMTDPEDGWYGIKATAKYLGHKSVFAWQIVELNDESAPYDESARYSYVLEWVQGQIKPESREAVAA